MEENKSWPEKLNLAYWWQTLEGRVLRCIEGVICASTTCHCSLHFDGFMIHRIAQPDCTTADFLHQLEQCLMDTVGFRIPFTVKGHVSFTQLLRAQDGRKGRVLAVDTQGEHGASGSRAHVPLP